MNITKFRFTYTTYIYNFTIYKFQFLFQYVEQYLSFWTIFWNPTKTRIENLRISVQFSTRELPSETISCIFGWCLYQNNPGLSWSLHFFLLHCIVLSFLLLVQAVYWFYVTSVDVVWKCVKLYQIILDVFRLNDLLRFLRINM